MSDPGAGALLREGTIEIVGQLRWSSNVTFVVSVAHGDQEAHAVYKPERGERPLWDFPPGLAVREVAACVLSDALGWDLVPPTVLRDGPFGVGSLQLFIECDPELHYFPLFESGDPAIQSQLQTICCFDLLLNNTDRKSGHCLLDRNGHVWAIDHGLTFHVDPKLRTVIWDFAGQPTPPELLADVHRLVADGLPAELHELLTPDECIALTDRARGVLEHPTFPTDPTGRAYPWPLV